MRFYSDFAEAQNEIKRDLAELSVEVQPETMQDIYVADRPEYLTKELWNYTYAVTDTASYNLIEGAHWDYINLELEERIIGGLNPGTSWKLRRDIWEPLLEKQRVRTKSYDRFSYTYSERMGGVHTEKIVDELRLHPHSRQLWLPVWNPNDETRRGDRRVPCSLGYWFVMRESKLHMTYIMRSCDFITHWPQDVALATMLLRYVAGRVEMDAGHFFHNIGSLHVYAKDVEGVF